MRNKQGRALDGAMQVYFGLFLLSGGNRAIKGGTDAVQISDK